jgi:hypothetical protein
MTDTIAVRKLLAEINRQVALDVLVYSKTADLHDVNDIVRPRAGFAARLVKGNK